MVRCLTRALLLPGIVLALMAAGMLQATASTVGAASEPLASGCGGNWQAPSATCWFQHTPDDVILRVEGTSSATVRVVLYGFNVLGQREERLRCSGTLACERASLYDACVGSPEPICGDNQNFQCVVEGTASGTYRCQVISSPLRD